jgi:hypothetical protein
MERALGRDWVLKVISLTCLGSRLLEFLIHADNIGRGSTSFGKVSLTSTLVTITLKLSRLKVPRPKLVDSGPRGSFPCRFISLVISLMHIALAIGSRLSCWVLRTSP